MARKKKGEPTTALGLPPDYAEFLESLKDRVREAQTQAMLSVNRELIHLYWEIGREIVQRQEQANWAQHVLGAVRGGPPENPPRRGRAFTQQRVPHAGVLSRLPVVGNGPTACATFRRFDCRTGCGTIGRGRAALPAS